MDELIGEYEVKVVEPGCAPGSARFGLQIDLPHDISVVFPYLNAVTDNASYDHENHILIWREQDQVYAFRPREIRLARIEDPLKAREIASEVIKRVNKVWLDRDNIKPRFTERKLPTVIDIFKLLPKTNCKQCGYPTCLAYAAALRASETRLEGCRPMAEPGYAENVRKLRAMLSSV